jgi:hypothetical protein
MSITSAKFFENRPLRMTFGLRLSEVTGNWRKLGYEEFHYLYSSPTLL